MRPVILIAGVFAGLLPFLHPVMPAAARPIERVEVASGPGHAAPARR